MEKCGYTANLEILERWK